MSIKEKIKDLRNKVLVHSCIYYRIGDSVVPDHTWDTWAKELAKLQRDNEDCCNIGYFDEEFKDFEGFSGYFLPVMNADIYAEAMKLLEEV